MIFYVKDTVFISHHLLQPFIIENGLWRIREYLKDTALVKKRKQCIPAPLKVPFFCTHPVPSW